MGHRLSYVKDNNLHIFWLDAGEAQNVTHDGLRNHVINGNHIIIIIIIITPIRWHCPSMRDIDWYVLGICDWVYEEEVLGTSTASWWSPDGSYVSFLRFEETNVPEYIMPLYQMPYNKGNIVRRVPWLSYMCNW